MLKTRRQSRPTADGTRTKVSNVARARFSFFALILFVATSAPANALTWLSRAAELGVPSTDGDSFANGRASDRYLVVTTSATNVAVGLDGTHLQVIRLDQLTGERLVVSQRNGILADADAIGLAVSQDGRHVAFVTDATNLLAAPTTGLALLRKDMVTNEVIRIPYQAAFPQILDASFQANGRDLQFAGVESDWMAGSPERHRVIVVNFAAGSATVLPVAQAGAGIAHVSRGTNCFVYFTEMGRLFLRQPNGSELAVDVPQGGGAANGSSPLAQVSDDCRFVVFGSRATNLLPGVTARNSVYRFDALSQTLEWVSINESIEAESDLDFVRISPDARHVYYVRYVIPGGFGLVANYQWKYRDMLAPSLTAMPRQDVTPGGVDASGAFLADSLSPFGLDRNDRADVLISAGPSATPELVMGPLDTLPASSPNGSVVQSFALSRSHTREGRFEFFASNASNLVVGAPTDITGQSLYVHDTDLGTTQRLLPSGTLPLDGILELTDVSSDGRFLLVSSTATSFVPGDTNRQRDLFLVDRTTNAIERVNVNEIGFQSDLEDFFTPLAAVSDDGQRVVFNSPGRTLSGTLTPQRFWYLRDRSVPITRRLYPNNLVTRPFLQLSANGQELVYVEQSGCLRIIMNVDTQAQSCATVDESGANLAVPATFSRDLRFVLYATNETPQRVLLRDRARGQIKVLPVTPGDIQLTGDGRYVVSIVQNAGEYRAIFFDTLIGSNTDVALPIQERQQVLSSAPQGPWLTFWSENNLSGTDQNRLDDLYRVSGRGDGIHGGGWQGGFE
jgi:hypothetical protein